MGYFLSDQKDHSKPDADDIATQDLHESVADTELEHAELVTEENLNSSDTDESNLETSKDKNKRSMISLVFGGMWRITRIALLVGIVVGALLAAVYVLQQDDVVRKQFEGKRWALPARVFARPLELYEGQILKPDNLHKELQLLNYSYVTHVMGTGQFKREKNVFFIQTRGFKFAEDS